MAEDAYWHEVQLNTTEREHRPNIYRRHIYVMLYVGWLCIGQVYQLTGIREMIATVTYDDMVPLFGQRFRNRKLRSCRLVSGLE